MCGILGWVAPAAAGCRAEFSGALDLLAHRGPDDRGEYAGDGVLLGHRRLSIVDLSANGHQPMVDAVTGDVIVFNGEIYNYIELRHELMALGHIFHTASDTEVLLHAFQQWGAECLGRFNGMWAFAIWQPRSKTLFVSRDRFGVKPFFYTLDAAGLAFASEPKALLALFPNLRKVDELVLYRFLAEGSLHSGERSFYDGICSLPAGHYAFYRPGESTLRPVRYWDYPAPSEPRCANDFEALEVFSGLLENAVRLRTRSDVRVGLTLSGGLDSTAVLSAAQRTVPGDYVCFTSVYGGALRGESAWAKMAGSAYGITPVEVEASRDGWFERLGDIAWHMDSPGYSPAVYPLWHVMQEARRQGVLVLLEGQGADEELGGYPQYAAISLLAEFRRLNSLRKLPETISNAVGTFGGRALTQWLLRETFPALITVQRRYSGALLALSDDFKRKVSSLEDAVVSTRNDYDPLTSRLQADHGRNILPALLQYGDAISMAHGVESRLPFLDYRLVEWIFSQPASTKIRHGKTKWVLRRYLESAGQREIANRKDKLGYPTPLAQWLSQGGGATVKSMLLAPDSRIRQYCDPAGIQQLIARTAAGGAGGGNHLYRLLSTEIWLRHCLP